MQLCVWLLYGFAFFSIGYGSAIGFVGDLIGFFCKYTKRVTSEQIASQVIQAPHVQTQPQTAAVTPTTHLPHSSRSSFHRCCPCCPCLPRHNKYLERIGDCYFRYIEWYRKYFGEDTRYWFILLVLKEMFEILVQIIAMFHYNGVDLLDSNKTTLAHKPYQIMLFDSIIAANSIIVGILWIMYIAWHNNCQGPFFKFVVFFFDTVFDSAYALYPIIVTISDAGSSDLRVIVGSLKVSHLYVVFGFYHFSC